MRLEQVQEMSSEQQQYFPDDPVHKVPAMQEAQADPWSQEVPPGVGGGMTSVFLPGKSRTKSGSGRLWQPM